MLGRFGKSDLLGFESDKFPLGRFFLSYSQRKAEGFNQNFSNRFKASGAVNLSGSPDIEISVFVKVRFEVCSINACIILLF